LNGVDGKNLKQQLNENISRLSCPYLLAIFARHHPLTKSLRRNRGKTGAANSDKMRQRTCRNMTPFVAGNLLLVVAFCRHQSCTAVAPEGTGSKSVRHLPLAQLEATTADANVARNLRNRCVTSSTQSNIIQRGSTSAVHAAEIVRPSHTQDKRNGAAKSGN
jgi:hypothetical protein